MTPKSCQIPSDNDRLYVLAFDSIRGQFLPFFKETLCSTYSITVFEKSQICLILKNCGQLNPNAPKSRYISWGLFGCCKMRHLGQFSTTVTIIVILLAALLVMIVLQLSCLKIGIATKGIFGPEHFLALLKKCQVW